MREIGPEELNDLCRRSALTVADRSRGIGRELTYHDGPRRTIVVHFVESDFPMNLQIDLKALLSVEESWTVVPRYEDGALAVYETAEFSSLVGRCVAHPPWLERGENDDLYLIGNSGRVLIAYDHHLMGDGMPIFLSEVEMATAVLSLLNQQGAELELFSRNG